MSVIHSPRRKELDFRVMVFPLLIGPLLLLLFLRLWYLQVVEAPKFNDKAEVSRQSRIKNLAPRGLIYDRNGLLIGGIKSELVVTALPGVIKKHPESLTQVADLLGVPLEKLEKKVNDSKHRPFIPAPIFVGVPIEVATKIVESGGEIPGIEIVNMPMREYKDTTSYSHVLGYVWVPNDKDEERLKEKGIEPAEYVGKTGIERSYEKELMGVPGAEVQELDAKRRPVRVISKDAAIPGKQLLLSIDGKLQQFASNYLKERGLKGGLVAIDPSSGEILCQVSSPTFDQSLFYGGISTTDYEMLNAEEDKPLINRTIASTNSPGSTFKIITALAAYRTGKLTPSTTFFCNGGYTLGKRTLKCLGHHGSIGFNRAMEKSCNTYFCSLGMISGPTALCSAAHEFGLGEKTGVELVGEYSGVVPDETWRNKFKRPIRWYGGDTLNMSVGQGYVSATPIQMANVAALVANRGTNYVPHLVRGFKDPQTGKIEDFTPKTLHKVDAEPWFWDLLQQSLTSVVRSGTAAGAQIPGVEWAGKTGSTEVGRKTGKTHSWFIGFAPAQNPKIAICMFAEQAGHGGEIAAPIARDIVSFYLRSLAKTSSNAVASAANQAGSAPR